MTADTPTSAPSPVDFLQKQQFCHFSQRLRPGVRSIVFVFLCFLCQLPANPLGLPVDPDSVRVLGIHRTAVVLPAVTRILHLRPEPSGCGRVQLRHSLHIPFVLALCGQIFRKRKRHIKGQFSAVASACGTMFHRNSPLPCQLTLSYARSE